jgi:NAD(P)-dependent dehydrogenase (short-subunit alcohol dehydrogenase family)
MNFDNRVAVITGAGGSLGGAVARRLAEGGARLALLGRSAEGLEQLAGELGVAEDRYMASSVDLSEPASAQEAAASVVERFGRVDMLIHLVGGWAGGTPVLDVPSEEVSGMLQQHVWTTLNAVQAFVPHMVEQDWGRVVAVSQPAALQPAGNASPYAIGKAGQEVLLLSLAQELRDTGVTANVVLVRAIGEREEGRGSKTTPEEIASTIAYLCSDDARMINGARIPAHGRP